MKNANCNFEMARSAFNGIRLRKWQLAYMATCDESGVPNIAPIGSMRIVDENTVHVLQGYLARTYSNLQKNPRAAFVVSLKPKFVEMLRLFSDRSDRPMGFRLMCEYLSCDESKELITQECRQISSRISFWFRKMFLRFAAGNIKRLLVFRINEIRPVH